MQNAHTRKTAYTFFCISQLICKENRTTGFSKPNPQFFSKPNRTWKIHSAHSKYCHTTRQPISTTAKRLCHTALSSWRYDLYDPVTLTFDLFDLIFRHCYVDRKWMTLKEKWTSWSSMNHSVRSCLWRYRCLCYCTWSDFWSCGWSDCTPGAVVLLEWTQSDSWRVPTVLKSSEIWVWIFQDLKSPEIWTEMLKKSWIWLVCCWKTNLVME